MLEPIYHGIDGCKKGWIIAKLKKHNIEFEFLSTLSKLPLKKSIFIIDMPVELPNSIFKYPRLADKKTKSFLGKHHSCVFYAPLKKWLNHDLIAINQECDNHQKPKLSLQSFYLFNKILDLQKNKSIHTMIESHPECIFKRWYKYNLTSKKTKEGFLLRQSLLNKKLEEYNFPKLNETLEVFFNSHKKICQKDDLIDALALSILHYEYQCNLDFKTLTNSFIY